MKMSLSKMRRTMGGAAFERGGQELSASHVKSKIPNRNLNGNGNEAEE